MNKGIQRMFSEISKKYEIINHILTFGLDIYWRRKCAKMAVNGKGRDFLDLCTGTGEMAMNLFRMKKEDGKVVALDFCFPMLKKAKNKNPHLNFVIGDAESLPFKEESFDSITISFATRNINLNAEVLLSCFGEFRRVLKKGGKFFNLETTQPNSKFWKWLFHKYVKIFVKPIGFLISGSETAYKYLSSTIPKFYHAEDLKRILLKAGFSKVFYIKLFPGVVALHIAER